MHTSRERERAGCGGNPLARARGWFRGQVVVVPQTPTDALRSLALAAGSAGAAYAPSVRSFARARESVAPTVFSGTFRPAAISR